MSAPAAVYRRIPLHVPNGTTTWNISDYTDTVLEDSDQYRVLCEQSFVTVSAKTSTTFTTVVVGQSPYVKPTAWLEFLRAGI